MDQVSSIYNPGNDFFWREEGPCRARARTSPARPSLGVPPTRFGGFPVTLLSQTRLNLQVYGTLGQPAWFVTIGWTGTSRSQVGVPPRMSLYFIWQRTYRARHPTVTLTVESTFFLRLALFQFGQLSEAMPHPCSVATPTPRAGNRRALRTTSFLVHQTTRTCLFVPRPSHHPRAPLIPDLL